MTDTSPWDDDPHVQKPNATGRTALEYLALTTDYLSIPLCLAAVLADLLIVCAVLKYRRLHTRTNMYLLNFAAFHALYVVSTPLFYVVLDIFYGGLLDVHWFCLWTRVENLAMALAITCIAAFGLDVYLEAVRPSWFAAYDQRYKYVLGFFYFSHALLYVISGSICFHEGFDNNFTFYFLMTQYLLTAILMLYLGIKNSNARIVVGKDWVLSISVTIVICWLPFFVGYGLMSLTHSVREVEMVLWYIAFLPEYLTYSCSIITVWKLWKANEQFKVAFKKFFRRSVPMTDYEELFVSESTVAK